MNRFSHVGLILLLMTTCVSGQTAVPAAPLPTAPSRIAVISSADAADMAALVTTELSSNPEISLVERDAISKIGDEAKLQQLAGSDSIALGKLVGASGLLFLEKAPDGCHVRFTAVGLGYALFDDELPTSDNPAELAKSIAHRVEGYAPKLALDPAHAVPISVLNLRAVLGTPATLALERNLTLLLESRLAAVPEFVVLERRHAWSLGFEHSLDVASKPLLRGAYVIDGTISTDASGDNCSVALRLREPGGGQEKTATLKGGTKDPGVLADQILAEIKKDVGRAVSDSGPSLIPEGDEYLHEALWAWRSNVPAAALEAVDSAELLGAAPENVVPLRIQILCTIADQGMERWTPPYPEFLPSFDASALEEKTSAMERAIQETVRYRDEKLEGKIQSFVPANGVERFDFRTGDTVAKVAVTSSKMLVLLEQASSPRADELRQALRAITGYDPLHGKAGSVQSSHMTNNGNAADVFADDWAQTSEEETAWLRLICDDTRQVLPRDRLADPSQKFCARFLKTPEDREKAFDDFVESLKSNPKAQRTYLVLKTHEKDPATADAAYVAYLNYLLPHAQEIATSNNYSPLLESIWSIDSGVVQRNPNASRPLVHAVLNEPQPGLSGIIVLRNLWQPADTNPADAATIWKEEQGYVKRRTDLVTQKEGRPDTVFLAEMDSVMYYFKTKFSEIVNAPAPETPDAVAPLVVTRFWHPWLIASTPVNNNVIFSASQVVGDDLWIVGYLNILEKGRIFKIHLPDMQTDTIDSMDGRNFPTLLWTPKALYAPLGSDTATQGFNHQLARYDFATSTWTKHDLPISYSPQNLFAVDDDIYLATGARGATPSERETGIAKYNWDADKLTLLASNRRRPGQNQFDDTSAYRVISIFAGPGNKPSVTTDTGTFFIQESPGAWPPVFDARFDDEVVNEGDLTLVLNQMGEITLIDAKAPAPIPWMAADEPIYRKAKGLPGVTGPVPTPWASEAIWDCPPGKQKQMGSWSVAFHDDRLFILTKPSPLENRFELLDYDKTHGRKPVHIPLKMELTEPEKTVLLQHPGHMPNGWTLDEIEQPPHGPMLLATNQGLCLKLMVAGFWFIPYTDLDAYLRANAQ